MKNLYNIRFVATIVNAVALISLFVYNYISMFSVGDKFIGIIKMYDYSSYIGGSTTLIIVTVFVGIALVCTLLSAILGLALNSKKKHKTGIACFVFGLLAFVCQYLCMTNNSAIYIFGLITLVIGILIIVLSFKIRKSATE